MLTTVMNEGVEYHALKEILDDGYEKLFIIRDDDGNAIPATVCICNSKGREDCVCGAWRRID